MENLKLLDCTLRDGMYVTDFHFDDNNKRPTIKALENAGVDIIECGFLKSGTTKPNSPNYASPSDIREYIAPKKNNALYVALAANTADILISDIPKYDGTSLDGIRIAFMKETQEEAFSLAVQIQDLGYKVMLQASRIDVYSDTEMNTLIERVNEILPYSLALVDTNGNIAPKEILSILKIWEISLDKKVSIDFHFHNNLQFAVANAIAVLNNLSADRNYIIDSSIFGMGQGVGNLPTELIMHYLNSYHNTNYVDDCIADIYDEVFKPIYEKTPWGYNFEHLISSIVNCHAFYAKYIYQNLEISHYQLKQMLLQIPENYKKNFKKAIADKLIADWGA
jgi:4-hydroxy 2-oxovalerate aldolase